MFERFRRGLAVVRSRLAMPLLAKELVEQASRKRTFILRTVYAALFFAFALLMLWEQVARMERYGGGPLGMLGRGREIFFSIVALQFAGIYFFLPAMMAGVITHEKERDSFTLLLLTDLRPWEIVVQKYISRLIPMLTFLLLSMPLLAVAYAYGGVTSARLWSSVYLMLLACLQVGAVAIFCSAFARSTSGAYMLTYALLAALYFGLPVMDEILGQHSKERFIWAFVPLFWLDYSVFRDRNLATIIGDSAIIPISCAFFLVLARVVLVRRALLPPKNAVLAAFRVIDRFFTGMNLKFGNITLIKDRGSLPEDEPVAWRERSKRALGKARYLIRLVVLVEVPILLILAAMIASHHWGRRDAEAMTVVLCFLWPIMALMVTVQAAGLFAGERARETLDVLMTTPLTGREILQQKMAAVRRFAWMMLIPFASVFIIEAIWESGSVRDSYSAGPNYYRYATSDRLGTVGYLICSFLNYAIYVPMCAWLAAFITMRMKSQARAMITAIGTLVAWCLGTLMFVAILFQIFDVRPRQGWGFILILLSPVPMVPLVEMGDEFRDIGGSPFAVAMVNYTWYGGITLILRALCYARADGWLGRMAAPHSANAAMT